MNDEQQYTSDFLEDQELLSRHRAGDSAAFGLLFAKHRNRALVYARKHTDSEEQAEEVVLEAFARILEIMRRGKGPTVSMGHYLVSTVRNVAISDGMRSAKEQARDPVEIAELYEREQFGDRGGSAGWVADAFNTLNSKAQWVLWFRAVEGMTSKDIARQLAISAPTATRLYQAGVTQLREQFVNVSMRQAPDPACHSYTPVLLKLAARRGRDRVQLVSSDPGFSTHLDSCERCGMILSRLRASERALLSIVFLAGLGTLATEALSSAPAAASTASWLSGIALPVKIAVVAVPLVATAVTVGLLGQWPSAAQKETITLGHNATQRSTSTLLRVDKCELKRESIDGYNELWHLSNEVENCSARIDFFAAGQTPSAVERVLDTDTTPLLRTLEVTRAGVFDVTLSNGQETKRLSVTVLEGEVLKGDSAQ